MSEPRVLITGDYWHKEFQSILSGFPIPVTLAPSDRLDPVLDQAFELIVLAQSRPDQLPLPVIEQLQETLPSTPMVALLGSWCEGGMRSDEPWPGVRRIYWHQWKGQFTTFAQSLENEGITPWHQPRTASAADDALADAASTRRTIISQTQVIAVSAGTQEQFRCLRDTIRGFGWQAFWAERSSLDQTTARSITGICLDGNSPSENLSSRIRWLQTKLPDAPITLVANFPRQNEVEELSAQGVQEVVSKPFKNDELQQALERAANIATVQTPAIKSSIKAPHMLKKQNRVAD